MFNKKAIGLFLWVVLIFFGLFVSLGVLIYSIATTSIPEVAEYSFSMSKTFESNAIVPTLIDVFMKLLNERSIESLDENKIFKLKSYCAGGYKQKVEDNIQNLYGGFEALEGKDSRCIIDEEELKKHFGDVFGYEYTNFNPKKFSDFDMSNVNYRVSVPKEDDVYFTKGDTDDMVSVPITTEENFGQEKQIGSFYLNASFKIPVDYAFDEKEEICILSVDCGATCDDVIAKYSEIRFEKKTYPCDEYFFCMLSFPDDFEKPYPCGSQYFCMEDGANSLACPDCHCLDDWRFIESCDPYGVPQYRTQERTCKHKDLCPDSMKFREVYDCCGYSYKSCGCGGDDCCIPYTGQEYCNRCEPCNCNYGNLCGPCGHTPCPPPPPPPPPPEP